MNIKELIECSSIFEFALLPRIKYFSLFLYITVSLLLKYTQSEYQQLQVYIFAFLIRKTQSVFFPSFRFVYCFDINTVFILRLTLMVFIRTAVHQRGTIKKHFKNFINRKKANRNPDSIKLEQNILCLVNSWTQNYCKLVNVSLLMNK